MKDLQFGGNMYIVLVYDPLIVLIESDWNLKLFNVTYPFSSSFVLIESDWNLKNVTQLELESEIYGINRIRLEFKVF